MSEYEKMQAKKEKLKEVMASIAGGSPSGNLELAKIVGSPFDPENAVTDVIGAVYKTDTVDIGEDYEYFVSDQDTKKVTVVVNGSVTQTAVTPLTTQDLSFSTRTSEEFLVYIDKLLEGKHDMLAKKRIALTEAMDRIDTYDAIQCIDTAVTNEGNTFTLDTTKEKFDYPKLVEMVRSIARYTQMSSSATDSNTINSNLVLITGANVTEDILLMDYDSDKNRETTLARAGISRWIPVDGQQVVLTSSTLNVIDPDVAYLIAPNMNEGRETAHFVRRLVRGLDGAGAKERISVSRGPLLPEGASPKWAFSVAGMEQTGCVVVNAKPIAKFTRS